MLRIEQLTKRFGANAAVDNVSFTIDKSAMIGVIGASGAGKSTLLRMINRLADASEGTIAFQGRDVTRLTGSARRKWQSECAMIFQQFNLMSNRTVFDNVAFNLTVSGYPSRDIHKRVMECLDIVDLTDRASHYPAQLSGGQKQRVGIARAIAPSPKVLLADEPTSALDPATTRSLLTCLRDINQQLGVTIVIVTHEMSVIRRLCDRAALLHEGQLLEVAQVRDGLIQATTPIGQGLVHED